MAVVTNRHSQDPKNDYNVCHSQRQPPWIFLADLEPRQALSWVTFLGFETISKAVSWLRNNIEKLMRDKSFYPVLLPVDVGILLSRMVPETIKVWQRMIAMYTTVNDGHLGIFLTNLKPRQALLQVSRLASKPSVRLFQDSEMIYYNSHLWSIFQDQP